MKNITAAMFEELLDQQKQDSTKRWTDLEIGEIFTITDYELVKIKDDDRLIVSLSDFGKVWAPQTLIPKLKGKTLPFYVRPNGLKQSIRNKTHKYHDYDLVQIKK